MWYTVRDNITGEILEFTNKCDAEMEAERRVMRHRSGYDIRRNHVDGCDAILIENGNTTIICVRSDL